MSVQGLGGEGPQLARQGEASSGAILGELWGSCRKLLKRHELGNLRKRVQGESGDGADRQQRGRGSGARPRGGHSTVGRRDQGHLPL